MAQAYELVSTLIYHTVYVIQVFQLLQHLQHYFYSAALLVLTHMPQKTCVWNMHETDACGNYVCFASHVKMQTHMTFCSLHTLNTRGTICMKHHMYVKLQLDCTIAKCMLAWYAYMCQLSVAGYITIITAYPITSDGCAPRYKKQEACHQVSLLAVMGNCFKHNTYIQVYLVRSYLRHEDAIHAPGLPITATVVSEWLFNSCTMGTSGLPDIYTRGPQGLGLRSVYQENYHKSSSNLSCQ